MTTSHSPLKDFDALFPELVNVLISTDCNHPEPSETMAWFRQVLEYNVPHGKKNRGVSVVTSYCHLVKNPTEEDVKIARVLGWCVELFQAYFLVADDMMDKSQTRRGLPCWYKKESVGLVAINDSALLECAIYRLLKKYIRNKPYYMHVMELFLQSSFQTTIGQCLDLTTAPPEGHADFSGFTTDKYAAIVKWKTAFYSFYLPVALSLYMAGISDDKSHTAATTILLKMGHYFQAQDDYLDCYGDPAVIGKVGTDIQDNKCSWLIVNAMELASREQRDILKENYGRWDEKCVEKVKAVYRDLDLQGLYRRFEDSSYKELVSLISETSGNLPQNVFLDYANRVYKRDK